MGATRLSRGWICKLRSITLFLAYVLNPLQVGSPPRTANGNAFKQIKAAAKAYEALGDAFAQLNNLKKLRAQITAGKDIWAEVSACC